uniref:Transmembrane protein n=1 Tax=Cacopsylla melanoneura TaxID=428564 RepID=A0A8D9AM71_9HEMI
MVLFVLNGKVHKSGGKDYVLYNNNYVGLHLFHLGVSSCLLVFILGRYISLPFLNLSIFGTSSFSFRCFTSCLLVFLRIGRYISVRFPSLICQFLVLHRFHLGGSSCLGFS